MKKVALFLNLSLISSAQAMEDSPRYQELKEIKSPTKTKKKRYALYCQIDQELYDIEMKLKNQQQMLCDEHAPIKQAMENNRQAWDQVLALFQAQESKLNRKEAGSSSFWKTCSHHIDPAISHRPKKIGSQHYLKIVAYHHIVHKRCCIPVSESCTKVALSKTDLEEDLTRISYVTAIVSEHKYQKMKKESLSLQKLTQNYSSKLDAQKKK